VIDGQGGGLGKSIVEQLKLLKREINCEIIAAGTNSAATAAMLKAGADAAATGENAIIYNSGKADIIAGAIGICFANSMRGEISPDIALAVAGSGAVKILIPIPSSKCNINIMGISEKSMAQYIAEAVERIKSFI
jgi:N-acetylglutamate synthase/N-acetylornithine aminotransferase